MTRRAIKRMSDALRDSRKRLKDEGKTDDIWLDAVYIIAGAIRSETPGFDVRRFCREVGMPDDAIAGYFP